MQLAILCSLDSFLAAVGMSFAGCPKRYKVWLALNFVMWDMLAAVVGVVMRPNITAMIASIVMLAGLAVVLCARKASKFYLFLPVLLCVDNLASGALHEVVSLESFAFLSGFSSGIAALLGFLMAHHAKHSFEQSTAWLIGMAALSLTLLV